MRFNLLTLVMGEKGAERKISITAAAILVLLVLVTGAVISSILVRQLNVQLENNLTGLLHDRGSLIHSAINTEVTTIEGVLARPSRLRELMRVINAGSASKENVREAGVILQNVMLTRNASAIELLNREGRVVSSDGEFIREPAISVPLQHLQHSVLLWKAGYFLHIAIPLQENSSLIGTLSMEVPLPDIASMLQNYSGLGETGEVVMCASLSAVQIICFPSRHQPAGGVLERQIEGLPLPMSYALEGKDGAMTTLDYRRNKVFVAYHALGNSGLGIVAKINTDELEQPIRKHLLWIVPFFAMLIALGFLLLRLRVVPLLRELVSSSRALKLAHDETQLSFAALQIAQTEMMQAEDERRLAAVVLNCMSEAVAVTDEQNLIVTVNAAFTEVTGYSPEEVLGKNPKLLSSGAQPLAFYKALWEKLSKTGSWQGEIWNRRKSGEVYAEWLSINLVRDEHGKLIHHVAVFSDISERKASEKRIHHLAHYDVLTDLPNRALFNDRFHQAISKAKRDKAHVALMFIDLDKFKPINDTLGHDVGDLLLREVAQRMQHCVRESDTVARIGGDEFVVLLPGIESTQTALRVAEKILRVLNQPFELAGHHLEMSASIGVAVYPEHGVDEKILVKNADTAMYLAKNGGRNNARLYQT